MLPIALAPLQARYPPRNAQARRGIPPAARWPTREADIDLADDSINPRDAPFPPAALKRLPCARSNLLPESDGTYGHGTDT